jgi:hypothetical protein
MPNLFRRPLCSPQMPKPMRNGPPDSGGFALMILERTNMNPAEVEVIDSTELAKRLNVPETWVRSWTNAKRTSDPIPHFRLGRYIRFPWGSTELREWLNRQMVSANGQGH